MALLAGHISNGLLTLRLCVYCSWPGHRFLLWILLTLLSMVDQTRIELATFRLLNGCSPRWATSPYIIGGPDGGRTRYLPLARRMLSQMSYWPKTYFQWIIVEPKVRNWPLVLFSIKLRMDYVSSSLMTCRSAAALPYAFLLSQLNYNAVPTVIQQK